jgi:phosphatidyl-myo-inositol dimannoside synthase
MNTLLFTLEYPPFKGGIANYYENVIKYWPQPDDIFVLNNNQNKLIKSWIFPKWLLSIYNLYKEIKSKKIDHILVGQILPLGTAAYLITKLTKTPYSVFIHGMDFAYAQKSSRKAEITEKILNQAVQIICTNSYVAEIISKTYDNKFLNKIHTVNPGVDNELRIKNYELRIKDINKKFNLDNKIILFSVGRLVKRKGFDKVIEAMPEVLKKIPDLVYLIAGTGPDEEYLKTLANKIFLLRPPTLKLGRTSKERVEIRSSLGNIIFLSQITDEEKWTWLNLCDIFITVSRDIEGDFEGFGIVYLEANLAGKPVIAGDSGGVKDAVKSNFNGLLIKNPEDKTEIANNIIKLAHDENLRKKLGEQGYDRVLNDFRWEDKVGEIYKIINK